MLLKLLIRRCQINKNSTHHSLLSSSFLHSLHSDSDDLPFTLATEKPILKFHPNKKKKQIKETQKCKSISPIVTPDENSNHPQAPESSPVNSDLPFDFRHSYSEQDPLINPIGFREPRRFSPFGPGRLSRVWTGTCAPAPAMDEEEKGREGSILTRWLERRERVLGSPLSEVEVAELVETYRHSDCNREIRIGRDGVTHNLLDDVHNHWKKAEAVRIKCLGIPTLDMENVCYHLEDKTGGKIIYRHINVLLLYRGRNYDPKDRPVIPLMLWKPRQPIYPRLVKKVADGLTFEQTLELRKKGFNVTPLMKLTRNGVYVNVVEKIRDAFADDDVVRIDCRHVPTSDCKRIGVKLRDLVPCVPILIKDEQIILWKGNVDEEHY